MKVVLVNWKEFGLAARAPLLWAAGDSESGSSNSVKTPIWIFTADLLGFESRRNFTPVFAAGRGFEAGVGAQFGRRIPPAAKAATDYAALTARLNVVPFQNKSKLSRYQGRTP